MRAAWGVLALGAFLGALLVLLPASSAASPSLEACSEVVAQGGAGSFTYTVGVEFEGDITLCGGGGAYVASAQVPVSLSCKRQTSGVAPGAPDSVTVRVVADNGGFGSATPSAIRSFSVAGCTSGVPVAVGDVYCTSDGTAAGSPRFGALRIHLAAVRAAVVAYNVHSENAAASSLYGVIRCATHVQTVGDFNSAGAYPWVGGDLVQTYGELEAAPYTAGSSLRLNATCAGSVVSLGAAVAAGQTNISWGSATVQGSAASWPVSCGAVGLQISGASARSLPISGYGHLSYLLMEGGAGVSGWSAVGPVFGQSAISGVTAAHGFARSTGQTLDRVLGVDCSPDLPVVNRGASVAVSCSVTDARGVVASGVPVRAYVASPPGADVSAFSSSSPAMASAGALSWSSAAAVGAPTSTGLGYAAYVETFGDAGRASGVLYGWGSSAGFVDVSASGSFDGLTVSRSDVPDFVSNVSDFVISVHSSFARADGLRDARGDPVEGVAVSCVRTDPYEVPGSPVALGNTDAAGGTGFVEFDVGPPAGWFVLDCSASWSGNSAAYRVAYRHVSPASADAALGIVVDRVGVGVVNVSALLRQFSEGCDCVARVFPDAGSAVRVTLLRFNSSAGLYDVVADRVLMNQTAVGESAYFALIDVSEWGFEAPFSVHVTANFSGLRWLGVSSFGLVGSGAGVTIQDHTTVIGSTFPFFALMAIAGVALVAAFVWRVPFFGLLATVISFGGWVLYREAVTHGDMVGGGPFVPILFLALGLFSIVGSFVVFRESAT